MRSDLTFALCDALLDKSRQSTPHHIKHQGSDRMQNYIEKLPSTFPRHLLLAGRWLGATNYVEEVAWDYPSILEALTALADEFYLITGIDVYKAEAGVLTFTGDLWSSGLTQSELTQSEPTQKVPWIEYVTQCHTAAHQFVDNFHDRYGDELWYAPVFRDG